MHWTSAFFIKRSWIRYGTFGALTFFIINPTLNKRLLKEIKVPRLYIRTFPKLMQGFHFTSTYIVLYNCVRRPYCRTCGAQAASMAAKKRRNAAVKTSTSFHSSLPKSSLFKNEGAYWSLEGRRMEEGKRDLVNSSSSCCTKLMNTLPYTWRRRRYIFLFKSCVRKISWRCT